MAFANRGVFAEGRVQSYLEWWQAQSPVREFSRLVDSKSAGRTIKAAKADFEYFSDLPKAHGLIEVKQTEHTCRLERSKLSQLPALRKREKCGGQSYVLVYHSTLKAWRCLSVPWLAEHGDKGSWNLHETSLYASCDLALGTASRAFPIKESDRA